MEYQKIVEKIMEKTSKSNEEVEDIIKSKIDELGGLVTKDGASLIVANDLDVEIESSESNNNSVSEILKIEKITQSKVPVSLHCKVIKKWDRRSFGEEGAGKGVQNVVVGDETGSISLTFWNEDTKLLDDVKENDILTIENGYTRENYKDNKKVDVHYNSQYGALKINPEGIEITPKPYVPDKINFEYKKINELEDNHKNVKIKGIVTEFEVPRFYFADPNTFKKVINDDGKFVNPQTGEEVTPLKVPIVNMTIDDGTSQLNVVGFRNKAEDLTGHQAEMLCDMNIDDETFAKLKDTMVGRKLEVGGNISISNLSGEKQLLVNEILEGTPVKTVNEIAEELTENKEKTQEVKKKTEDIEEIDFDDDL